ncbi:hypothetical protein LPJ72_002388 [Coemansia sp. Benny D160-2]|nr:hypothetical protein LPJ72_002388 [Coemansia sp. Benny D160-2]
MEPRRNAYEMHETELPQPGGGTAPADISSVYQPYAGSYSESSWHGTAQQQQQQEQPQQQQAAAAAVSRFSTAGSSSLGDGAQLQSGRKNEAGRASKVGMEQMSHWRALRFVVYITMRAAQLVVSIVSIGFVAHSRSVRPSNAVDTTQRNTEVAIFVVGGVTAVTSAAAIACHIFARTRKRIEKSRMAWFTCVLNFAIFAVWIVLVLISVVSVDCSRKTDGAWCTSIKTGLATALVSAMLALVMVLRSFSVLVRAKRVRLWSNPTQQL